MSIRTASLRLALFAFLVAGPGCIGVVPYTPKTSLIDDLGYEEAQTRFGQVMTRCRAPKVNDGKIDEKKFEVDTPAHYGGGWGWYGGHHQGGNAAFYHSNVGRLDVYENNKVFVIGTDEKKLAEFLFADQPDAFLFCDLIYSFRTYKGPGPTGGGGGSGGGGGGGGEERRSSNVLDGDKKGEKSGGDESSGGDEDRKTQNVLEPR